MRPDYLLKFDFDICCCSLLLRRECCTFSNGEYIKAGLAELELWCGQAKEEVHLFNWHIGAHNFPNDPSSIPSHGILLVYIMSYAKVSVCYNFFLLDFVLLQYAGSSWDELTHIRQAVGFLVRFSCPLWKNIMMLITLDNWCFLMNYKGNLWYVILYQF